MPWWAQLLVGLLASGSVLTHVVRWYLNRKDKAQQRHEGQEDALYEYLRRELADLREKLAKLESRVEEERRAKHEALQQVTALTLRVGELERENARLVGQIEAMRERLERQP